MKLNTKRTLFIGFAFFVIMMFWQVYDNVIAKILINSFGLDQTMSGIVMALDNILALFLLPVFGTLSDKTKTKYGKRTPYIFFGIIAAAVLIMGLSIFDNAQLSKIEEAGISDIQTIEIGETEDYYQGTYLVVTKDGVEAYAELENGDEIYLYVYQDIETLYLDKEVASLERSLDVNDVRMDNNIYYIGFVAVLFLILIAMAVFRTPAVSLMPDVTPKPLRSKGNAVINLMGAAGGITALGFMTFLAKDYQSYTLTFVCLGVIMLICLLIFMLNVKENKFVEEMEEESQKYGIEETAEVENNVKTKMPKDVKTSFILILLAVCFWYMAYNAATSKFSVYAGTVLDTGFTMPLMIANAAAIVSYFPIGILSSKYGRKSMVIVGVIILFLAFLLGTFVRANSAILIWVVMALAGIGWATISVNSYPMIVEMSKSSDVGKYTGIYYTAAMAAQIATPVLSGLVMDLFGMTWLFPYSVVFCVLAFITMIFVKHGNSVPIPKDKLAVFEDLDN